MKITRNQLKQILEAYGPGDFQPEEMGYRDQVIASAAEAMDRILASIDVLEQKVWGPIQQEEVEWIQGELEQIAAQLEQLSK